MHRNEARIPGIYEQGLKVSVFDFEPVSMSDMKFVSKSLRKRIFKK